MRCDCVLPGRVKILSVPDRGDRLFFSIFVQFIDIGKEEEVKSHQIFQLPEQFHSLPDQAVEIVVCRVKPVDAEVDWHPKVSCPPTSLWSQGQKRIAAIRSFNFLF